VRRIYKSHLKYSKHKHKIELYTVNETRNCWAEWNHNIDVYFSRVDLGSLLVVLPRASSVATGQSMNSFFSFCAWILIYQSLLNITAVPIHRLLMLYSWERVRRIAPPAAAHFRLGWHQSRLNMSDYRLNEILMEIYPGKQYGWELPFKKKDESLSSEHAT
jgi:hypothetical protein